MIPWATRVYRIKMHVFTFWLRLELFAKARRERLGQEIERDYPRIAAVPPIETP